MSSSDLFHIAKSSLEANIVELQSGKYLRAGANQFGSLWTRDFCFASKGLELIGRSDVVDHHVWTLIKSAHPESGLIPRILESGSSALRVCTHCLLGWSSLPKLLPRLRDPLKPEYLGEHKTPAMDSNSLCLIVAHRSWQRLSPRQKEELIPDLQRALRFLENSIQEPGWIEQSPFSDWQDSASRAGFSFYVNILAVQALKLWSQEGLIKEVLWKKIWGHLKATFLHPQKGIFLSGTNSVLQTSLEGNLFVLDFNLLEENESFEFWKHLRSSSVWIQDEIPGIPVEPAYDERQISWTTKKVGLRGYHDRLLWPWLSSYAAKVCFQMGDELEGKKILRKLTPIILNEGYVPEVLDPDHYFLPFKTALYKSEGPFSWSSALLLEALEAQKKNSTD
jgi:hypothetical protein